MELDFAFLAQVADVTKEGKLIAFGISFDAMLTDKFPAQVLPFALVVRFVVSPDEVGKPHKLRVERTDPDGQTILAGESDLETIPNAIDRSLPTGASVVSNIQMGVEKPGDYQLRVLLDDVLYKTIPLHLFVTASLAQEDSVGGLGGMNDG